MTAPSATRSRDLSLDLLKAFSMLLVVFFHNAQLREGRFLDNLFMVIPMAAVPCFFMASGAVFFHRPFDLQVHLRRTLRFYLTVVLWKLIYLVLYCYWGAPFNASLRVLFSYLFLFQQIAGVGTAHFWFMDGMLTVMLAAPFLYLLFDQKGDTRLVPRHHPLLLLLLGLLILFNQIPATGNLVIMLLSRLIGKPALDLAPLAEVSPFSFRYSNYFTYYLLGGLMIEYKEQISKWWSYLLVIGGCLGLLLIQFLQTESFLWQGTLISGGYYWLSTMALAVGIFLLFTGIPVRAHIIPSWIARYVGSTTLWIFYMHMPLIYLFTPTLFQMLAPWNGWVVNLLESCLIVGIGTGVGYCWEKIFSRKHKSR